MKWGPIHTGDNRQKKAGLLVVLFLVIVIAVGMTNPLQLNAYDDYLPGETSVYVTTTRSAQNVYTGVSVTITGTGEDRTQVKELVSNDFIIAVEPGETQDNAVLLYYVNGNYEYKLNMVGIGGDEYVKAIPGYPLGTVITYQVYMRIGSGVGRSDMGTYTVQTEPTDSTDPTDPVIPIQDQIPPEFNFPSVTFDGDILTYDEFLGATVYGTLTLQMDFTKGGNNIWGVGLHIYENVVNGVDKTFSFVKKTGTDYTWVLVWDTTNTPDGVYEAELIVRYWEGVVRPTGEGNIIDLPYTIFSFNSEDGSWNIDIDYTMMIVIVSVVVIGILGLLYVKMNNKKRRKGK